MATRVLFLVTNLVALTNGFRPRSMPTMAGFGAKPAAAEKRPELTAKRQANVFAALVKAGEPQSSVFAKLDGGEWQLVGRVAAAPGSAALAAQVNKRLILEHAARMEPSLSLRARELVAGVASGPDAAPVALARLEVPAGFRSGFVGERDPSGFYTWAVDANAAGQDERFGWQQQGGKRGAPITRHSRHTNPN